MKVAVGNSTFIESDSMQFIIKQYTGKFNEKTGQETYKTLGYYSDLKHAVKKLLKLKVMESKATTLKELLEDVERIEKEIDALIKV